VARKYSRDNRGRFASGGGGATARGGRLKTAAGNKRAGQTMQRSVTPSSTVRAGVMRKPAPANNAPMTRKDRESIAAVKRGKAGKPNAEDRMIQQAMARRGVTSRLGQPMPAKPAAPAKAKAAPKRKAKTADDLLTQATRIQIKSNAASRRARTGADSRRVEERGNRASAAARSKAFEMSKPKPLSKTAQMKVNRLARTKEREAQANMNRLVMAARQRR
jgi:hypothetical protein